MHFVYIIYSNKLDKYYTGETESLPERIEQHNEGTFDTSYTTKANDWQLFWSLECKNRTIARKIEEHIKSMKSRNYFINLKKYSEIGINLLKKYSSEVSQSRPDSYRELSGQVLPEEQKSLKFRVYCSKLNNRSKP